MLGLFYDTAIVKKLISTNEFNEKTYGTGVEIDCRKVFTNETIVTTTHEHKLSTVKVYTVEKITTNDIVDDCEVLKVMELKSLVDGGIVGYKVSI